MAETSRGRMGRALLLMACVFVLLAFLTAAAWVVGDWLVDLVRGLVAED
jgi:hypothetical protein